MIGRTSSFQFKGRNEDLRVIGEKLNVAHILEGSVRKSGEKLRITAQLIRAADVLHLWSETYDRTLDDIFVVQGQIAGEVVKALKLTLLGNTNVGDAVPGAVDPEAYNLALQGGVSSLERRGQKGLRACRSNTSGGRASAIPNTPPAWGVACRGHTHGRPTRGSVPVDGGLSTSARRPLRRRWRLMPNSSTRTLAMGVDPHVLRLGMGGWRTPAFAKHWTSNPATPRPSGTSASWR